MALTLLLWVIIILIALIGLMFFLYYNKFVRLSNQIDNALSQIDVQLRRRADLIPNLLESVKGYMKHEKGVITEVTNARKALIGAKELPARVKAGDNLQSALGHLFAIAENYPNLKANENFLHLQQELSAIEDKVAYARQYYNDGILYLENASQRFPGVLFFKLYRRQKKDYLKIPESNRKMPEIDL